MKSWNEVTSSLNSYSDVKASIFNILEEEFIIEKYNQDKYLCTFEEVNKSYEILLQEEELILSYKYAMDIIKEFKVILDSGFDESKVEELISTNKNKVIECLMTSEMHALSAKLITSVSKVGLMKKLKALSLFKNIYVGVM